MLRYLTAGESHGPQLTAIVEGLPANLPFSVEKINHQLWRRQQGYGRGGRMRIETDQVKIGSGVRFGKTMGTPVTLVIENRDWKNWEQRMSIEGNPPADLEVVTKPRPGHADLAGALKYDQEDIRNVLERASARNTATLVAIGAVARQLLEQFNIHVYSHVVELGPVKVGAISGTIEDIAARAEQSQVRVANPEKEEEIIELIKKVRKEGNSLGGIFEVVVTGVPVGLGSYSMPDRKLDSRLAGALMGIQAIKGVEIGLGFDAARRLGSDVHDEIFYSQDRGYYRDTNGAGGLEGGVSNGQPIVVRAAMKPIPTLYKPLRSVDMASKDAYEASIERSDVCAVPAAAVVGEAVTAWVLAQSFLEKFGGDSLEEIKNNYGNYQAMVARR
ncbi:chorismate synthase [Effusibacillus lacus]|uniref:Chorismate synthase n=1 Tax=Effusibacillus lacus TaxID=1348429 RepID=A0A292YGM9_9BACL|nr:chorismate synthase [Effusibacillus lacus]TCS75301.1 chorismate synthase [Effusibacillus lacus]GAX89737.1 chorismate synthase [Effusibacillus lacus]